MPELPEVETVRNTLKLNILNKKIKDVKVYYSNIIQNVSKEEFINKLKGQTFIDVLRKGKFGQFYGCSGYPKCKYTKQI